MPDIQIIKNLLVQQEMIEGEEQIIEELTPYLNVLAKMAAKLVGDKCPALSHTPTLAVSLVSQKIALDFMNEDEAFRNRGLN